MPRRPSANLNLFTIPPGVPFARSLAEGLMERYGADPAVLGQVTVLLPTRRAAKTLREEFLRLVDGRPMILPVMRPVGDVDEDEVLFFGSTVTAELDLPPAAPPLWRQLTLTRLVEDWQTRTRGDAMHPAQAAVLAQELGRLLDQVAIEGLDFSALNDLVKENFAAHWQETLDFLDIVTSAWPAILTEAGFMDGAERRTRLTHALTDLWAADPPAGPVIAAGSTGSLPATARLLAAVARLPEGAVVLPGLDTGLDGDSWDAIDASHPQYAMKELLTGPMGAKRDEVRLWRDADHTPALDVRRRLLREALRPAATTTVWPEIEIDARAALDGLARIDAPGPREEAGAIALLLRGALEVPDRTAALVTPDRSLARRVAGELERWGIEVDDSAGVPLDRTPPGAFLKLTADLVADNFVPLAILACLKHPLAAVSRHPAETRALVRQLERAVLRGPRPAPGVQGIRAALEEADGDGLSVFWSDVARAAEDFVTLTASSDVALRDLVEAHVRMVEVLAGTGEETGAARLWAGDAGETAARFIEELLDSAGGWTLAGEDYPALLATLMAGRPVRPRYGKHPRLQILGPLEARLLHADLIVLGGLNEGTWPPEAEADPWMSRPMRETFGLPPLEARVGLAAHDFVQATAAPDVVLTRAEKVDGTPTVPSRWLLRLEALLRQKIASPTPWLGWFEELDRAAAVEPDGPPRPAPPVAARPNRLSVTQIQTWMRDPYAIYARHILGLEPLDPIDADPGAAEKGTIIHEALDKFLGAHLEDMPPDALEKLVEAGREAFGPTLTRPAVRAFWWPRFLHVAEWFVVTERERRRTVRTLATEIKAEWPVDFAPSPFTLVAKADRIDRKGDGRIEIIDYKTGMIPTAPQIRAGFAPQLPLEALMAEAGAFGPVPAGEIGGLAFWRLHGGDPPAKITEIKDYEAAIELARDGFEKLLNAFSQAQTPYLSYPRPEAAGAGDYDHLARVREWSGVGAALAVPDEGDGA